MWSKLLEQTTHSLGLSIYWVLFGLLGALGGWIGCLAIYFDGFRHRAMMLYIVVLHKVVGERNNCERLNQILNRFSSASSSSAWPPIVRSCSTGLCRPDLSVTQNDNGIAKTNHPTNNGVQSTRHVFDEYLFSYFIIQVPMDRMNA